MTRKEAIARIEDHIEVHRYYERNAVKIFEALDMAIKALEQPECEDAVSREAVLDEIHQYMEEPDYTIGLLHDNVCGLPSVTPKKTVTRQERYEIIERLERLARYAVHTVGELPFVMSLDDGIVIHEAIDMLKSQSEPQWIPCSRELPKEDGEYNVTVKYEHVDGYEDVYSEHGYWIDGHWDVDFGHCGKAEKVIAWMPLPKPWEGGHKNSRYRFQNPY